MGFFSFRRQKETTDESAFTARAADGPAASRGRSSKRKESEPVDPVLPEKQRARRRLVGAVALVLAAVIGLPMILDPEPKPLAHDIAIDIPSKEKSRKGASAPATAALDAREEIMETASVAGAAGSKAPGAAGPGDVPSAAISVEAQAPADSQKAELAPTPKAGATGTTKADAVPAVADAKPVAKPSTGAADDARARALLDGQPSPAVEKVKLGTEKPERYVVQVAALASPEKVLELQNRLKAAGIKSHTQKVATQSGDRIRVRVGPVQGKPEAEKIRAKLTKLGLNGTLVPA
jgi:DedD protein